MQDKSISSIQFVDDEGSESPKWGYGQGEFTDEIHLGIGKATEGVIAGGLKLFFGDNGRHVTYNDSVMVGLQALVSND
jgi:hypothetical protein